MDFEKKGRQADYKYPGKTSAAFVLVCARFMIATTDVQNEMNVKILEGIYEN